LLKESDDFPLGGRLRHFAKFWRLIAPRKDVLRVILGVSIPFTSEPRQTRVPPQCKFDRDELIQVRKMVDELLVNEVIEPVSPTPNQFVSQLFLVTNKDLSRRAILNVKQINQKFLPKQHFKMETLQLILPLIKKGDWFGSWDLRKGYFNIALHPDFYRFFCFDFEGRRFQFKCLVMGLSLAPWFFTKVMMALVQLARSWGISVSVYLDDSLTRAASFDRALKDHEAFGNLLQMAGFLLHRNKSVQRPVQRIEHLGFVIDSRTMCLEVPEEKERRIREAVKGLMKDVILRKKVSIRKVARVIGLLVSIFPAVRFGRAHYRVLEREKLRALNGSFDFNRKCRWPKTVLCDLRWWRNSPQGWKCSFETPVPTSTLITDASLEGWGVIWDGEELYGPWDSVNEERIDELELLAILYAVQCWPIQVESGATIQLWCDNQVAVAYIRNMGGRVERLNRIASDIWAELESRNVFMVASYINTKENPADALTRGVSNKKQLLDCEVQLNPEVFGSLCGQGPFDPEIDWFASRVNAQLPRFFSWKSEPTAEGCDAFNFDWGGCPGYVYPPFILIPRILRKINEDKASVLLIHPNWPGALWAPDLRRMTQYSVLLPISADLLRYPDQPGLRHPMKHLRLAASWLVGGS
jgi:hypothetical protein